MSIGRQLYPYLVAFVAAVGGFLFGYDLSIISGAQIYLRQTFQLDAAAFGFAVASAILGCMAGPIAGIWVCDAIGRKKTLMLSAGLFGASAIGTALPRTIAQFYIFRIIGGVGVGLASVVSPMYIAEMAPARIRGRLVTMNQLAIVVGSLSAILAANFLAQTLDEAVSWRWMFGSELVPIVLFVVLWGIHLTQVTPRCSMRLRGGLSTRPARVRGTLRQRRGLSRLSVRVALAGGFPLSGMRA